MRAICLALLILAQFPLCGQVRLMVSPEPEGLLPFKHLPLRPAIARICNYSPTQRAIPEEVVYLSVPDIPLLISTDAATVLTTKQSQSPASIAAMLIGYGVDIAATVTGFGFVAANQRIVGLLTGGAILAPKVQKEIEAQIPTLTPFLSNLLSGSVVLPGMNGPDPSCATRRVFSVKSKKPFATQIVWIAEPPTPAPVTPAPAAPAEKTSTAVQPTDFWHQLAAGTVTPREWLL